MSDGETVHATALIIGEGGILIRGGSGAGKSTLARELLAGAERAGRHAALVCDDRVHLSAAHGRLVARVVPAIAGLLEIRGIGLVRVPHAPAAVIRLVVDLEESGARLPDEGEVWAEILGLRLPRIAVNGPLAAGVVLWRLGHVRDASVTVW